MTLKQFIKDNRLTIDELIDSIVNQYEKKHEPQKKIGKYNDEERRLWILNDQTLYSMAKRNGVKNI